MTSIGARVRLNQVPAEQAVEAATTQVSRRLAHTSQSVTVIFTEVEYRPVSPLPAFCTPPPPRSPAPPHPPLSPPRIRCKSRTTLYPLMRWCHLLSNVPTLHAMTIRHPPCLYPLREKGTYRDLVRNGLRLAVLMGLVKLGRLQ